MQKKDILEIKKRFKKDYCTFSKLCGCYVNGEKYILTKFRESFLNLEEAEYHKYLEIAKSVLSGTVGNNLLELSFPVNGDLVNERQVSLMQLKSSQLKDDALLDEFYQMIIDSYEYTGNYIILLFHDTYDVLTKTTDNLKLDESEEVYEYVLCAICPMSLTEPGLSYSEEENKIRARRRDWGVDAPTNGFMFPAFSDRSSDVNAVMYYTKNAKDTHPELMENVLGCTSIETAAIQKESFQSMVKESFGSDEEKADAFFMDIQENLKEMVADHKASYGDTGASPMSLSSKDIQELLTDSGVAPEITAEIEASYKEYFRDDLPLAQNLMDTKVLKANEQRKKEVRLQKQVNFLKQRLDQVKQEDEEELVLEEEPENGSKDSKTTFPYDVILQVKPEKVSQITSQVIDGQKCIVIPIYENESTTVNGLEDLI